jgi:hypothetical protein
VQVAGGRLAQRLAQHPERRLRDVGDQPQPEPAQRLGGLLAHAPQRLHRQRVEELERPGGRHDQQPVGLAPGRGELGQELGRRDADGAGEGELGRDPGPDLPGDLGRPPEQPLRPGHVEERLVDRERLDQGRHVAEEPHHLARGLGVGRHVRRQEHRLRAQPPRLAARHRAADAERSRLVAGRADHAARPGPAHHHRPAAQFGSAPHLDRGEERVHVDVQDRAPGVVRLHTRTLTPTCDRCLQGVLSGALWL